MAIYKYHNTYMYMTIMIHLMILSHLSVHVMYRNVYFCVGTCIMLLYGDFHQLLV